MRTPWSRTSSPKNCFEIKANKDYHFKVDNNENEHLFSLKTIRLGVCAKAQLHIFEAEALNYEGNPITSYWQL